MYCLLHPHRIEIRIKGADNIYECTVWWTPHPFSRSSSSILCGVSFFWVPLSFYLYLQHSKGHSLFICSPPSPQHFLGIRLMLNVKTSYYKNDKNRVCVLFFTVSYALSIVLHLISDKFSCLKSIVHFIFL